MSYIITRVEIGEVGVSPGDVRIESTNTLGDILSPGYITNGTGGVYLSPTDIISASYSNGDNGISVGLFAVTISNGEITLTQSEVGGDVTGPTSSFDNAVALFAGNSGKVIKTIDFTPEENSLFGFDSTATPAQVTVGSGLTLSDGTLTASGAGSGDVIGPDSASVVGALSVFTNTNGKHIGEPTYDVTANSLIGYGPSTNAVINITAGTNVSILDGVISVESGSGNVTGTGTPTPLTFPVYADDTGLAIEPAADVTLTANNLIGTNGDGTALTNITAGSGITILDGVIASSAGGGNVTGSGTPIALTFPVYSDTTGLAIEPAADVTLTSNNLIGTNGAGSALTNITAGTGISIDDGVITATAIGGDVTGPESSTAGGVVFFDGTTGKIIEDTPFDPAALSLLGYNDESVPFNVTIGTNLNLSDEGVLSASGGSGGGDVTGPDSSIDGNFAIYSGPTGKFIDNPPAPIPSSFVTYNANSQVQPALLSPCFNLSTVTGNYGVNPAIPIGQGGFTQYGNYTAQTSDWGQLILLGATASPTFLYFDSAADIPDGWYAYYRVVSNDAGVYYYNLLAVNTAFIFYPALLGTPYTNIKLTNGQIMVIKSTTTSNTPGFWPTGDLTA